MNNGELKPRIREAIWSVVDRHASVQSATLTGSFIDRPTLEGISDIDLVLVLDRINRDRFDSLMADFTATLTPILAEFGFRLRLNPTLGPLKFNEPELAVLHVMLYSVAGHIAHVIDSPFTCLDWQRSPAIRKRSLAEVYPVFGLQPRHFLGARRSLSDYLRDFRANAVSYRELICDESGYQERKQAKPMTIRDRHEFAYHVMRFLMRNLLKLVQRRNDVATGADLPETFFAIFPVGRDRYEPLLAELTRRKLALDFDPPLAGLDAELEAFLADFEQQFRRIFEMEATTHLVFRHAETTGNRTAAGELRFLGRSDAPIHAIADSQARSIAEQLARHAPSAVWSSPAGRCRATLAALAAVFPAEFPLPMIQTDERLLEIDYGQLDGLSISEARRQFPEMFTAWARGDDPTFPGGENTEQVAQRVRAFADTIWATASGNTITCTHNGVIRCLVGELLGMPMSQWFRLQVPHLEPITVIQTREFGRFVNLPESTERALFQSFAKQPE
ncbi:histidine phosphatase family protein [Tuwongella immobilis]|uniref:Uncharacterized protein n=1 Tax=Tuwongella immobilis TaxID=692036 RepID=A0A6C2YQW9_9BACT|nr:histidine phosphatase family protein [Tuwongella immobilis]VIP03794.1 phosphoglycerate mutase : Phosphoglycerate mutase OS=Pirellula staleyi (strain ATCC 27377 / DSM 6068 / ICPB 4128) GN=Psta_4571 PE=4 SV=1: His_Phos_1 [Tuwongella immobilis]VTS04955.1 phosphoglycerate mutase : Phosphoglycerate mutase OS=Pirellula staleyi (strain ATCC 27377 / DSM 6068 / ICPB 4128) GN=Psta_4571 PE=4 SV=1: His_Phos_1 [Tuwongella immobilis]